MQKAINLMNDMCRVLISMERSGIQIDIEALSNLEKEYSEELNTLKVSLDSLAKEALGDTPFKLSSNDSLSMLVYSRKPLSKKKWSDAFNLGTEFVNGVRKPKQPTHISKEVLARKIKKLSSVVYKTTAQQCVTCKGTGKITKRKKNGGRTKPIYNCHICSGKGIDYKINFNEVAGFQQLPSSTADLAVHGYSCNKTQLEKLAQKATGDAKQFLTNMVRFNAVSHYLNSFIKGIRENVGRDGILHTQFMQCVTATGRLSSRSPNFHNQPRGGTFPIRKVVISRWEKGSITEADYSQLEFRVAAALSKDKIAIKDIIDGVDVHTRTANTLTEHGQVTSRQDAKTHTFKPLYGGTSGTKAEQAYYKSFLKRYIGIEKWHKSLLRKAATYKSIWLPSEREYKFPWAKVNPYGGISGGTKIKNYPVQGFATADIVPLATIALHDLLIQSKLKSCIINEVHDSIVVDTYHGEGDKVVSLMSKAMLGVIDTLQNDFNYTFIVPLEIEIKRGKNWLDMKVIHKESTDAELSH